MAGGRPAPRRRSTMARRRSVSRGQAPCVQANKVDEIALNNMEWSEKPADFLGWGASDLATTVLAVAVLIYELHGALLECAKEVRVLTGSRRRDYRRSLAYDWRRMSPQS